MTKETENGIVKTYQTDKVGNITYAEIAGVGTTYTYDNLNRMTGATFEGGSASYTYDDAGRLTGETKGGITTTYTYNPAGWLSSKTNTEGTETDSYALTYYADGNIRTKTENTVATTYVYDGRGQLTRENDISYSYDLRGNRSEKVDGEVETVYTYGEDNTLLGEERTDGVVKFYNYDQNGNMTSWTLYQETENENGSWEVETVDSIQMTYDPMNRMTRYQADGVTATYTYGIDNMRKSKTVNGVTTNYIWDGGNIVAEADSNNAVTNRYFRGVGLIASMNGTNISYYQTDSHGDVSKWGTVDYSYDAFGNETIEITGANPFRYNGEYFDEETGFIYLRNRYYNPTNGRFTTEDPAKDGLNWYAYCANNPVMFVDPWGLTMDGDENLSEGAQIYIEYYTQGWGNAYNRYNDAKTEADKTIAQYLMTFYHCYADDIRRLDSQGLVNGKKLQVPAYNQLDVDTKGEENRLCWATVSAMFTSFYSGDEYNRTKEIAQEAWETTEIEGFNRPMNWWHPKSLNGKMVYSSVSQSLSETDIAYNIQHDKPYGMFYSTGGDNGHLVAGVGYAIAEGHSFLTIINDPMGGEQMIYSYNRAQYYSKPGELWEKSYIFKKEEQR